MASANDSESTTLRERLIKGTDPSVRGRITDMSLYDVLEVLCESTKSALVHVTSGAREGDVYVRDGVIVDATLGDSLPAGEVMARILGWKLGRFQVAFGPVQRPATLAISARDLPAAYERAQLIEDETTMEWDDRLIGQLPGKDR
jgi:hypothetical protein